LYRKCLVAAKEKPGFITTVKQEFRKHAARPKNETMRIEFLLRNGQKKLEMIQDPQISGMGHFIEKK
jgi:succinate dehydrogenase assembly factor 1